MNHLVTSFKKSVTLLLFLTAALPALATDQDDWRKAVISITTYDSDGKLIHSGNGFFIGENGEAIASYALLEGASKAVAIDANGKKHDVMRILGASQNYDLVRFQVGTNKNNWIPISATDVSQGEQLTVVPYSIDKKSASIAATVSETSKFDRYAYYTLTSENAERLVGCPVITGNGEVVAITQLNVSPGAKGICAIDVEAGKDLHVNTLSYMNKDLQSIHIQKALPSKEEDALSYLYMFSMSLKDSAACAIAFDDFIRTYPENGDIYLSRAEFYALHADYSRAEADIEHVTKDYKDKAAEAHYTLSKLVYNKIVNNPQPAYKDWTAEKALAEAQAACDISKQPLYRLQLGYCQFVLKQYDKACETFLSLAGTDMESSESYYYAARSLELSGGDSLRVLALTDSAVARCERPLTVAGAPFVLARAGYRMRCGLYREAAADYSDYENAIGSRNLNAHFYYLREQAELNGRMYQQALDDIDKAISLEADAPLYHLERAALMLRVGENEEALRSAQQAQKLSPDNADAYLLAGIALGELGQKAQALEALNSAKAKGSTDAEAYIGQYSK